MFVSVHGGGVKEEKKLVGTVNKGLFYTPQMQQEGK